MIPLIKAYVGVVVVFLALDSVWLGYLARDFYFSRLSGLLRESFDVRAAAVFYVMYTAGIVFFAVRPALASSSVAVAAIHGALLGMLAYATYDLTNLATLKGWPLRVVLVDIAWGTVLTAAASLAGYASARLGG